MITFEQFTPDARKHLSAWTHTDTAEIGLQLMSLCTYAHSVRDEIQNRVRAVTPASATLVSLINSFVEGAAAYFGAAVQLTAQMKESGTITTVDRVSLLHAIIRKLATEWTQIEHLVPAVLMAREPALELVTGVVKGAHKSLNIAQTDDIHVVPLFGTRFELTRFAYAPGIALLSIPAFDLYNPWKWSVIWHELAALVLRDPTIQTKIDAFVSDPQRDWDKLKRDWEALTLTDRTIMPVNGHGIRATLEPADVADFGFARKDWVEEFVEDACTVLSLGPIAYEILKEVMIQHYGGLNRHGDTRHPHPALRVEAAYQLLKRLDNNLDAVAYSKRIQQDFAEMLPQIEQERPDDLAGTGALDDSAARMIADWVFDELRDLILRDISTSDEAQAARDIVLDANRQIRILKPKLSHMTEAQQENEVNLIWKDARETLNRRGLLAEEPQQALSYEVNGTSRAATLISRMAELVDKGDWDGLANLSLSGANQAVGATSVSTHSHSPNNETAATIWVSLSGTEHGTYHSLSASHSHSHPKPLV